MAQKSLWRQRSRYAAQCLGCARIGVIRTDGLLELLRRPLRLALRFGGLLLSAQPRARVRYARPVDIE